MNNTLRRVRVIKGGPSSGNFGHAGRPGKVGGSAPGKGGKGEDEKGIDNYRDMIESGKWKDEKKMGGGSQADTYYTTLEDGTHVIHKEYKGWVKGINMKGSANNDEAAYGIATMLDIDNVPMTVATDRDTSFQEFAENSTLLFDIQEGEGFDKNIPIEDLENMIYLDVLIGNWDRRTGNMMVNNDTGRLVFIDNSSSLNQDQADWMHGWDKRSSPGLLSGSGGREQVTYNVEDIVRSGVTKSHITSLSKAPMYPKDNVLKSFAAKIMNKSNFNSFVKNARSPALKSYITGVYGGKTGNKVYKRMMWRLDAFEEYVGAVEDVQELRQ